MDPVALSSRYSDQSTSAADNPCSSTQPTPRPVDPIRNEEPAQQRSRSTLQVSAEALQCCICKGLAAEPVEAACCHQLFCLKCASKRSIRNCPHCRRPFSYSPSTLASRLIGEQSTQCPCCNTELQRSNLTDHLEHCTHRHVRCGIRGCHFVGERNALCQHLIQVHEAFMLGKYGKLLSVREEIDGAGHLQN